MLSCLKTIFFRNGMKGSGDSKQTWEVNELNVFPIYLEPDLETRENKH